MAADDPFGRAACTVWFGSSCGQKSSAAEYKSRWRFASGEGKSGNDPFVSGTANRWRSKMSWNASPNNDAQRSLQSRALQTYAEGAQTRLQLFTQTGGSIPTPFLIILVFWLSAIFVSFTLFAQINLIVIAALFVCALSFAGAIFLILELDNPFRGLMGISSTTLRSVLLPLPASPGAGSSE